MREYIRDVKTIGAVRVDRPDAAFIRRKWRMKRILFLTAAALVGLTGANARAGDCDKPGCDGLGCGDPCSKLRLGPIFSPAHAQKLIEQLRSDEPKHRIDAARKLGCRLHADFCKSPEVLDALTQALSSDVAWQVRWQAAWSLAEQGASVPEAVYALYVASKLDKNYNVRFYAGQALRALTAHCKHGCKDLCLAADEFIARVGSEYDPSNGKCVDLVAEFHHGHLGTIAETTVVPAAPNAEPIPAPKDPGKDSKDNKEAKEIPHRGLGDVN
jgi:hypothetical protein